MCKVVCAGAVLFFFVSLASAQIPSGNVFVGYSFENTSSSTLNLDVNRPNLHGWDASLEGKLLPWVGLVADVSGHYGSENFVEPTPNGGLLVNVNGHEQEYLFGPRLSVKVGKFTPFGRYWSALLIFTPEAACRAPRILRWRAHMAEASTIKSSVPSPCAWKATTFARASIARRKIISGCRLG